jgi:hypothetical protein
MTPSGPDFGRGRGIWIRTTGTMLSSVSAQITQHGTLELLTSMFLCRSASGRCSNGSDRTSVSRGSQSRTPASGPLRPCQSQAQTCLAVASGRIVTGTGQVQSSLPMDNEEFLFPGAAGAGVGEHPLVLSVVFVPEVCPIGCQRRHSSLGCISHGTSRRHWCHPSRR